MFPVYYYSVATLVLIAVVIFFVKLLRESIIEKVKLSLKHDYDERLEKFKDDLTSNQTILNNILASSNNSYQAYQTERINAIKIFWENYLSIRESISMVRSLDSFILRDEFSDLYSSKWKGANTVELQLQSIDLNKLGILSEYQGNIELVRPYLNESIWIKTLFLVTFVGRIQYLYKTGTSSKSVEHFMNDSALVNLLQKHLKADEFKYIKELKFNVINSVQSFVEQSILSNIQEILKGNEHSDNTFTKAKSLIELMSIQKSKA